MGAGSRFNGKVLKLPQNYTELGMGSNFADFPLVRTFAQHTVLLNQEYFVKYLLLKHSYTDYFTIEEYSILFQIFVFDLPHYHYFDNGVLLYLKVAKRNRNFQ